MLPALGYLSWSSPQWGWAAIAAVGIPLAVHLLGRPRYRPVVFPAARFMVGAAADVTRMVRLRQRVLMLWRMGILLLIVAAFARPIWQTGPTRAAPAQTGLTAVLLLDRSASMSRADQGVSLFEQAQHQVIAALRSLEPGRDQAMVVLVDRHPRALPAGMTGDLVSLIQQVKQIRVTQQRGSAAAALQLAQQHTAGLPEAAVHVFSDMQASDWQQALSNDWLGQPQQPVRLHPLGRDAPNVALGQPTVVGPHPTAGQVSVISLPVYSFSRETVHTGVVMTWQGTEHRQAVELSPGGRTALTWVIKVDQPGWQHVRFDLDGPTLGLDLDDSIGLGFHAAASRAVVVVGPAGGDGPGDLADYIQHALQAAQTTGGLLDAGVRLIRVEPDQLAGLDRQHRGKTAIWLLAGAGRFHADALAAVADHLRVGGGVLWLADRAAPENLRALAALMQWQAPSLGTLDWQQGQFLLGDVTAPRPWLMGLAGPIQQVLAGQAFAGRLVSPLADKEAIWMRFADGQPALLTQSTGPGGAGRLMVWLGDLSPVGSDFVYQPAFVVWLHELIEALVPISMPGPMVHPGDQPIVVVPGDVALADVSVTHASTGQAAGVARGWRSEAGLHIQLEPVQQVGRYDIHRAGRDERLAMLDVMLDPGESDLTAADRAMMFQADPSSAGTESAWAGAHKGDLRLRKKGAALWPWLLIGALVLLAGEPVAAGCLRAAEQKRKQRQS